MTGVPPDLPFENVIEAGMRGHGLDAAPEHVHTDHFKTELSFNALRLFVRVLSERLTSWSKAD